jgi:hypothetical protein
MRAHPLHPRRSAVARTLASTAQAATEHIEGARTLRRRESSRARPRVSRHRARRRWSPPRACRLGSLRHRARQRRLAHAAEVARASREAGAGGTLPACAMRRPSWEGGSMPAVGAHAAAAGERSRHQPACCSLDAGKCSTWRPRAECGEEEMDNGEGKVFYF